jgi:hypothetical protein
MRDFKKRTLQKAKAARGQLSFRYQSGALNHVDLLNITSGLIPQACT